MLQLGLDPSSRSGVAAPELGTFLSKDFILLL
jgi:hypothetical protein